MTTTVPPVELSAWLRARIAQRVNAAQATGLNPHNGPSIIVWPLGTTGTPGSRRDLECDRCGHVPPKLVPTAITAAPRMILVGGLCPDCVALEGVSTP